MRSNSGPESTSARMRSRQIACTAGMCPGLPPPIMRMSGFVVSASPRSSIRSKIPEPERSRSPNLENEMSIAHSIAGRRAGFKREVGRRERERRSPPPFYRNGEPGARGGRDRTSLYGPANSTNRRVRSIRPHAGSTRSPAGGGCSELRYRLPVLPRRHPRFARLWPPANLTPINRALTSSPPRAALNTSHFPCRIP